MRTILITGGAGFIGGNLVHHAVSRGERVVNLDALTYAGNLQTLAPLTNDARHIFVHGSITDRPLVSRLLREYRPWAVVNLAAESHVDRSIDGPDAFVRTNTLGTFEILEAARAYWESLRGAARAAFRFLHVSTDEVYGSAETGLFREDTPYAPNSPYAASKAGADHLVRAYHRTYGLPALTTNCSNNYGPYQFPEKLIPLMVLNCIDEKPLPVYGDGLHVRDWLYVLDHCKALFRVLEAGRPGETYNIGGENEWTNIRLVETICTLMDSFRTRARGGSHQELITFVPDRPGHDRRYALDAAKVRSEIGWRPELDFRSGLEATVRWYLENRDWWEPISRGRYGRERLGLAPGRKS